MVAIWSPSSPRKAGKGLVTPALRSMEPTAARSSIPNLLGCVQRRAFVMGPIVSFLFFFSRLVPGNEVSSPSA